MITKSTFPSGLFPDFIAGLLKAIGCHNKVVAGWLCLYIYTRVRRIEARVNKLLEQLRAGTYRAPKPRAWVFPNIASIVPADACKPGGSFGWVNRLLRDPANPYTHIYTGPGAAGHLEAILQQDAEIQEFAKTCPAPAEAQAREAQEVRPLQILDAQRPAGRRAYITIAQENDKMVTLSPHAYFVTISKPRRVGFSPPTQAVTPLSPHPPNGQKFLTSFFRREVPTFQFIPGNIPRSIKAQ